MTRDLIDYNNRGTTGRSRGRIFRSLLPRPVRGLIPERQPFIVRKTINQRRRTSCTGRWLRCLNGWHVCVPGDWRLSIDLLRFFFFFSPVHVCIQRGAYIWKRAVILGRASPDFPLLEKKQQENGAKKTKQNRKRFRNQESSTTVAAKIRERMLFVALFLRQSAKNKQEK